MAGVIRRVRRQDPWEHLQQRLDDHARDIQKLKNQHSPTVPIYHPDFPDDAVDGQFSVAGSAPGSEGAQPYWFWNERWRPFAGEAAWCGAQCSNVSVPPTDLLTQGFSDADNADNFATPWPDFYTFDGDTGYVSIVEAGFYLISGQSALYGDPDTLPATYQASHGISVDSAFVTAGPNVSGVTSGNPRASGSGTSTESIQVTGINLEPEYAPLQVGVFAQHTASEALNGFFGVTIIRLGVTTLRTTSVYNGDPL